jgi:hypothetical protein
MFHITVVRSTEAQRADSEHTNSYIDKLFRFRFYPSSNKGKASHLATSLKTKTSTEARMHLARLANDQAVLHQASDVLSRVGVGDFVDFIPGRIVKGKQ